jgi:hypothetical protein
MLRIAILVALLLPAYAFAQTADAHHMHAQHAMTSGQTNVTPTEPGQSAFATIQEIVALLEADPATDWSKVNIDALRQHLIDMDNVTLRAEAKSEPVEGGIRFIVTGVGPVKNSIQRMVTAHAATMSGLGGWTFTAVPTDEGANLTVVVPAKDLPKLKGLGFIGIMTRGMHHQAHHLMIARGENPRANFCSGKATPQ